MQTPKQPPASDGARSAREPSDPSNQSLGDLVRKYKVCYEVSHELGSSGGSVRPIGFEIELAGTHGHDPQVPSADCEECARLAGVLARVLHEILPEGSDGVTFAVSVSRSQRFTPKHGNRPELTGTMSVLHDGHVQEPVDERETRARDAIVSRLRELRVPEGAWSD